MLISTICTACQDYLIGTANAYELNQFEKKHRNCKTTKDYGDPADMERIGEDNEMTLRFATEAITILAQQLHADAKKKGWWDHGVETSIGTVFMNIVTELGEGFEEARNGNPPIYQYNDKNSMTYPDTDDWDDKRKPEGECIELADTIIRILDYCGHKGYDIGRGIAMKSAFNKTREYRHGKLF